MFFHSWTNLLAVAVTGISAYAALIAILRISGKRTLAKMNAFDLVVMVALGCPDAEVPSRGVDGALALLRSCMGPVHAPAGGLILSPGAPWLPMSQSCSCFCCSTVRLR